MKKLFLISAIFLIILSSSVLASVSVDVKWQTAVETIRPGAETTIALTVSNTGTTDLTSVVITPSGGASITATSGKIDLGGIPASGSSQASISVRADKTSESKTTYVYLKVEYYTGSGTYVKSFTIPITIKREPILQIINVNYSDIISPGKTLDITFDVRNSGTGPAKELIVSLNQSNEVFTILGSAGEIVVDTLNQDETKSLKYTITIDPEADVGISSIPVDLKYYDESKSDLYSDTKYIGLAITGKIDFIITTQEVGGITKISIANRGTAPAEYLSVVATSGGMSKEYYIGSLDSGDYETVDFPLAGIGRSDVIVNLTYKDKFNNEYTVEKKVSASTTVTVNPFVVIILIAIFGGTFWYYNKHKKKVI